MNDKTDTIHQHGYWFNTDSRHHVFDSKLCEALISMFRGVESVLDIGCGDGSYIKRMNQEGFACIGYDGNPNTEILTDGLCGVMDFAEPVNIGNFELVLCLEVGEHIPRDYEQIFIDNVVKCSKKWIVLSWGLPGQPGWGHVNCQDNDYIIDQVEKRNFLFDIKKTLSLREDSEYWWFKDTIMVYYKK